MQKVAQIVARIKKFDWNEFERAIEEKKMEIKQ